MCWSFDIVTSDLTIYYRILVESELILLAAVNIIIDIIIITSIKLNTFTAIVDLSRFNNSCLKSRQREP